MSADNNPYEAPRASVADVEPPKVKRPATVTVALAGYWFLVIGWTIGVLQRLHVTPRAVSLLEWSYIVYLVLLVLVPAILLVKIGQASRWARLAALAFSALDTTFRLYLFWADRQTTERLGDVLASPVMLAAVFALLYSPPSNAWFRRP